MFVVNVVGKTRQEDPLDIRTWGGESLEQAGRAGKLQRVQSLGECAACIARASNEALDQDAEGLETRVLSMLMCYLISELWS